VSEPRRNHEQYEVVKKDGVIVCEYGLTAPRKGAKWSGNRPIPKRGERVRITMNKFGTGIVRGYFVEHGYQGIYVELDNPPKWYLKQTADDPCVCGLFFGVDLGELQDA